MIEEKLIVIATRIVGKGDTWKLLIEDKIYGSLTDTLEAYFQKTQKQCDFRLSPLKGELYMITTEEIAPAPPKKFNLYGDW